MLSLISNCCWKKSHATGRKAEKYTRKSGFCVHFTLLVGETRPIAIIMWRNTYILKLLPTSAKCGGLSLTWWIDIIVILQGSSIPEDDNLHCTVLYNILFMKVFSAQEPSRSTSTYLKSIYSKTNDWLIRDEISESRTVRKYTKGFRYTNALETCPRAGILISTGNECKACL